MSTAHQEISEAIFGKQDYPPRVKFYDHAVYDEELSKQSGRPRYVEKLYVMFKPTHPDLTVRDVVSFAAKEEHKIEYALQWAEYQKAQLEISEFKPPLQAVPGMRISAYNELQALKIYNCGALAEYEGDLGDIDYLRQVAKRIMEVSDEARDLREKREALRKTRDRQQYRSTQVPGGSVLTQIGGQTLKAEAQGNQEKSNEEKGGEESFTYNFQVNM